MHSKKVKQDSITRINSKVARDINRSIILDTVRRRQPVSRATISEITHLNKSTVSNIVATLLQEELLVESPDRGGSVGRVPVNLTIKQGSHFVGALSLDAPLTRVAVVDIDGTIRARDEIVINAVSPESLVSQCVTRLNALRAALGPHKFHGLGATVGGIVDSAQSHVMYAANLGWNDVNLGSIIRKHVPESVSIGVENDAKAAALAELLLGKLRLATSNMIFLSVGPGIGAGIVIHGRIFSGSTHAAGEVGHMTVVEGGEQCSCGNRGCWELYVSERAPVRWFAREKGIADSSRVPSQLSDVFGAARLGDQHALNALRLWAEHIGVGIGDMIDMLDPEAVVVGGSITQIWDLVSHDITRASHGRGKFARQHKITIRPTSLADNPSLLGAAALSIRKIFADYSLSL